MIFTSFTHSIAMIWSTGNSSMNDQAVARSAEGRLHPGEVPAALHEAVAAKAYVHRSSARKLGSKSLEFQQIRKHSARLRPRNQRNLI